MNTQDIYIEDNLYCK